MLVAAPGYAERLGVHRSQSERPDGSECCATSVTRGGFRRLAATVWHLATALRRSEYCSVYRQCIPRWLPASLRKQSTISSPLFPRFATTP
jgi:hypothetical protein